MSEFQNEAYLLDHENGEEGYFGYETKKPYAIKQKKKLSIVAFVYDEKENLIREHHNINFNDEKTRRWVNQMMYWAIINNYTIEFISEKMYGK